MNPNPDFSIPPQTGTITEFSRRFSQEEVSQFSILSQDDNPLHLNSEYAMASGFKKPLVHGVLLLSMFSRIFGNLYPGRGSVYLSQSAEFLRPAYVDELILARVKLDGIHPAKKTGSFLTECFNEAGKKVLSGRAEILFPAGSFPENADNESKRPLLLRRPKQL